jgi:TolB-like protein
MSSAKVEFSGEPGPKPDDILQQLERVLASDEFHSPERGRKFLRFVVTETLEGRAQFLKAFTIANEIFGRQSSFDAQNDPVVRIEAGRIRRGLERYYLVAGQSDPIVITIPKGGYVPHFDYVEPSHPSADPAPRSEPATTRAPADRKTRDTRSFAALAVGATLLIAATAGYLLWPAGLLNGRAGTQHSPVAETSSPMIVVENFQSDGEEGATADIAQGLRDEIIGQLATFDDIIVVADPSRAKDGNLHGFALQGSVQRDGNRLRSISRLIRRSDAAVIWANNYDADLGAKSILQIQADIGQDIAVSVAQPYGAIFVTDTDKIAEPSLSEMGGAYDCTLAYYSYRRAMDAKSHAAARDCLLRATERFPDNATSWALLSLVYLDEIRFRYKLGAQPSPETMTLATKAAERATTIAPSNTRALQAAMLVSFFTNDIDKALKLGAAAYAANANDTEVAGEYGLRLAMSGKWQSGCELVSRAVNKDAGPKGYYEVGMALCAYMRGDLQAAELWSRMSDLEYNPMHRLVLLSILGAEGKTEEAAQLRDWLNAHAPEMMKNVREEVSRRLQRPEDLERMLTGLRAVGVGNEMAGLSAERPKVNGPK